MALLSKFEWEQFKFRLALTIFSSKWFSFPYINSIRHKVYQSCFGFGRNLNVQENVWILRAHRVSGSIKSGRNLLLCRNVLIDYTGNLEIGNHVSIAEGAKILTHGHDFFGLRENTISKNSNVFLSSLVIGDNVHIGTRSIIMPDVHEIGENSIISAGSLVDKRVPPNVVVAGSPAKIVVHMGKMKKHIKTDAS